MILFKSFIENQQHPMPGSQKYQTHIVQKKYKHTESMFAYSWEQTVFT